MTKKKYNPLEDYGDQFGGLFDPEGESLYANEIDGTTLISPENDTDENSTSKSASDGA